MLNVENIQGASSAGQVMQGLSKEQEIGTQKVALDGSVDLNMQQKLRARIEGKRQLGGKLGSAISAAQRAAAAGSMGEQLEGLEKLAASLSGEASVTGEKLTEKEKKGELSDKEEVIIQREFSASDLSHDGGAVDISFAAGATIKITASDFSTSDVDLVLGADSNGALVQLRELNKRIGKFLGSYTEKLGDISGRVQTMIESAMGSDSPKLDSSTAGKVAGVTAESITGQTKTGLAGQANIDPQLALQLL